MLYYFWELVHTVVATTEFSSFWCRPEVGSVPNRDGNGNKKMGLIPISEGVDIAVTMA